MTGVGMSLATGTTEETAGLTTGGEMTATGAMTGEIPVTSGGMTGGMTGEMTGGMTVTTGGMPLRTGTDGKIVATMTVAGTGETVT